MNVQLRIQQIEEQLRVLKKQVFDETARAAKKAGVKKAWLNIYPSRSHAMAQAGGLYATRAQADAIAKPHRLACILVDWAIGEDICEREFDQ